MWLSIQGNRFFSDAVRLAYLSRLLATMRFVAHDLYPLCAENTEIQSSVEPPTEWQLEEDHFHEVQRRTEDLVVRSTNVLKDFGRVLSQVLVRGVLHHVSVSLGVQSNKDVEQHQDHNEGVGIIKDSAVRVCESLDCAEIRAAQHGLHHSGGEETGEFSFSVSLVQTDKSLQETDRDDEQQEEEDERLSDHFLDNHNHCSAELQNVQVQEQPRPHERSGQRQQSVRDHVELVTCVEGLGADSTDPHRHGRDDDHVQRVVEGVRELHVEVANVVQFDELVDCKAQREQVVHHLDGSQMGGGGVGVDDVGVKHEIEHGKHNFQDVLVERSLDSVRIKVLKEVRVAGSLKEHVIRRVRGRLDDPATPDPLETSLVAARGDDDSGMGVDSQFQRVFRLRVLVVEVDGVPVAEHRDEERVVPATDLQQTEHQTGLVPSGGGAFASCGVQHGADDLIGQDD
ncbi:hypothetical protein OGAPHI_001127 [Ogataea philodendri]|uniref:Uncharacterized protein n=1 Tax=Ogataea philodendri TaxID=1378263 RepID=A0A9P8PEY1_9ASCO|nr:uncharacterized protein OGAPHI_001127 [Ogataea philodendri]KAH3670612.1 hypothetical protein OGAPHI_001127 [Ogataea philodendri]